MMKVARFLWECLIDDVLPNTRENCDSCGQSMHKAALRCRVCGWFLWGKISFVLNMILLTLVGWYGYTQVWR